MRDIENNTLNYKISLPDVSETIHKLLSFIEQLGIDTKEFLSGKEYYNTNNFWFRWLGLKAEPFIDTTILAGSVEQIVVFLKTGCNYDIKMSGNDKGLLAYTVLVTPTLANLHGRESEGYCHVKVGFERTITIVKNKITYCINSNRLAFYISYFANITLKEASPETDCKVLLSPERKYKESYMM